MDEKRVLAVMSSVFGVPSSELSSATTRESIGAWDSLAHIHFIVALEAESGVSFTPDEALALDSVKSIMEALKAKAR